jgi:hypothetical protein
MTFQGLLSSNSTLFLNSQCDKNPSKSPCIDNCACLPITVAIGIVVSLGGVFLLLAYYQILPHGINAISGMRVWGQVIGYGSMGVGWLTIAANIVKKCVNRNDSANCAENEINHLNGKENTEKNLRNESLDSTHLQLENQSTGISEDETISQSLHSQEIIDTSSNPTAPLVGEQTLEEQRQAAITIQKHYRGYLTRKRIKEIKKRERAALTIQSFVRMRVAQKLYEQEKKHVLSYALFERAKSYTEDSVKLTSAPNAPQGANKYKIYMPLDLPVVIRVCKDEKDFSRFPKMQQALAICSKNKFRCIEVPKARLQGSFIVEERLPGENASTIKGMAFYYENREHYKEAIKEFTTFLCYGYLSDIVGGNKHIINYLGISKVPRFDNLLLYSIEHNGEKLYKIGIIDFETFQLNSTKPSRCDVYYAIRSSVQLFPYHFDDIIELGITFFKMSRKDIESLRAESQKSMQLYKIVCEDNFSFYERHNITLQKQTIFTITSERREELKRHMGAFVRNMHEHGLEDYLDACNCLNGDPDESALCFQEKLFPKMIRLVEEEFKAIFSSSSTSIPLTHYGELIEERMVTEAITSGLARQFQSDEEKSDSYALLQTVFSSVLPPIFAIFEEILNQLVKGGELSYYKAFVYGSADLIFF